MNNIKQEEVENQPAILLKLPTFLKREFKAEAARRGFNQREAIRMAMQEKLKKWQKED